MEIIGYIEDDAPFFRSLVFKHNDHYHKAWYNSSGALSCGDFYMNFDYLDLSTVKEITDKELIKEIKENIYDPFKNLKIKDD